MNLEESLHELRTEPVPEGAMEQTIRALAKPRVISRRRPVWLVPVATTCLIVGYAFWPGKVEDKVWGSAIEALKDAKSLHIRFEKPLETTEIWRKGLKERLLGSSGEVRYNGLVLTNRLGFLSSVEHPQRGLLPIMLGMDFLEFQQAEAKIEGKKAVPIKVNRDGKEFLSYTFAVASSYGGEVRVARVTDRYPDNNHIGSVMFTVMVDPSLDRIVRVEQFEGFDPGVPADIKRTFSFNRFSATVDYPSDIPDSMFEPPAKTFDYKESKKQVASLLAGKVGEATVAGQKIVLKGVLCDGMNVYAVWDGCPGDFNGPDRFRIDGVELGPATDIRCFSSAKCRRPESAACPHSLLGASVSKPLPDHVDLELPVFEPDHRRPILSQGRKMLGYYSRKIGEAQFKDVPVTLVKPLANSYEREFGLYRNFW